MGSSLIIQSSQNKTLSKEQKSFNTLSKKIDFLRTKITTTEIRLNEYLTIYSNSILPEEINRANKILQFAKQLYNLLLEEKLSKTEVEKLKSTILNNLDEAFRFVIPEKDIIDIYNALNKHTYEEELEDSKKEMLNELENMFKQEFDMDVDFSSENFSEEELHRKIHEIKSQIDEQKLNKEEKKSKRKKSKKQLERETLEKQEEELKKKNTRSIYLSLVKLLHPDLVKDEKLKFEREELIKKVTSAYQSNDLHTLLKLEIEIIHQQSENLDHLTEEKLKVINRILKEQVQELEYKAYSITNNPKYEMISTYVGYNMEAFLNFMKKKELKLKRDINFYTSEVNLLQGTKRLKYLKENLKHIQITEEEDDFEIDEDLIFEIINNMSNNSSRSKRKK